MTDPTLNNLLGPKPLSLNAQFVLDAYGHCLGSYEAQVNTTRPGATRLASAIRAASARIMRLGYDSVNSKYLEGIEASSDLLDQIATELENQP
jgi:hypothetical protein